jgi:hypothetical protein
LLQINTGKLFTRAVGRENAHRGVLYTNLAFDGARDRALEGPLFGRLTQTTELSRSPRTIVYEFTERIEARESGPGLIVSHGADPYLQDMAVVCSLAMNCVCTPDLDLARRLTGSQRSISSGAPPSRYIRRVFDKEVFCQPNETDLLARFVTQLLGLQRKTYLGVMRAIRTYVTGLHRVADDLELAYTLLVAAGESLAQDFDGHEPTWGHVAEEKRVILDCALEGAPDEVAQRVRNAILAFEHTALRRRFQEFVTSNVAADYFRTGFDRGDLPIGRSELSEALSLAYTARSKYVHQLRSLPDSVTMGHGFSETAIEGRSRMLTLQGLSRLMRHIIMTFVERQPSVDKEAYDYHLELSGVTQVRLVPNYWVGRADGDLSDAGRDKLEGFLEELASHLLQPDSKITDLTDVLSKFAVQAQNMKAVKRLPYLAIHMMYSALVGPEAVQMTASLQKMAERELDAPSSESLMVHTLFRQLPDWPMDQHRAALDNYRSRRGAKSGIRFPRLFEAAIALDLAERYRAAGNAVVCKGVLSEAADDFPECEALRVFAEGDDVVAQARWWEVLLPKPEPKPNSVGSSARGEERPGTPALAARKRRVRTPRAMKVGRR